MKTLVVMAMLLSLPAFAAPLTEQTGEHEMIVHASLDVVVDQLIDRCVTSGYTVDRQTTNTLGCNMGGDHRGDYTFRRSGKDTIVTWTATPIYAEARVNPGPWFEANIKVPLQVAGRRDGIRERHQ